MIPIEERLIPNRKFTTRLDVLADSDTPLSYSFLQRNVEDTFCQLRTFHSKILSHTRRHPSSTQKAAYPTGREKAREPPSKGPREPFRNPNAKMNF
jgi:hypothetical protein